MSLLKNILQLIQEEIEKKEMSQATNQTGNLKLIDNEKSLVESYVQEIQTSDDELLKKIEKLELKISRLEKKHEENIQNLIQIDKNMKTLNADFALIADAVTQLMSVFIGITIVEKSSEEESTDSVDSEDENIDEIPLGEINDWDDFQKKYKKRYQ
jgi:hypothetical protein